MSGKTADIHLIAGDILYVPNSVTKQLTVRAVEAAINIGTGIAVWGGR